MEQQLGSSYGRVWADKHVMRELGGRTAAEALEQGESPKTVWRAVHASLELPAPERGRDSPGGTPGSAPGLRPLGAYVVAAAGGRVGRDRKRRPATSRSWQ